MKRGQLIGILIFMFLISMSFVAAQQNQNQFLEDVKKAIKPFLESIFGKTDNIFALFLFALIIFSFVYMALSQVPALKEQTWVIWIICISVAVLGVRFIAAKGFVDAILFPQGVLGVSLLVAIPFVVYFWFVEFGLEGPKNIILRKIAWVIFAMVYIVLWYNQFYNKTNGITDKNFGYIYLFIPIASFILLLIDGSIQKAIGKAQAKSKFEIHRTRLQAILMQDRHDLEERRVKGIITDAQYNTLDTDLKDREKHAGLR